MSESVFGLPTHILVVHAPVVLGPLVVLVSIAVLTRTAWRRRFGAWLLGAATVVVVALFAATRTGEAFDEALEGLVDVSTHEELAETTMLLAWVWLASLVGVVVSTRRATPAPVGGPDDGRAPRALVVSHAAAALAVVLGVLVAVWIVRTGHEGARVTWTGVVD